MNEPRKTIGGRTFQFGMLPAETAFDVFSVLLKNLGESLLKAFAGVDSIAFQKLPDDATDDQKALRQAAQQRLGMLMVGALTKGFNQAELKEAIKSLLFVTACLDQKPKGTCEMNLTFNGRLLDMFKVVLEAIKVNFADFLAVFLSDSNDDVTTSA